MAEFVGTEATLVIMIRLLAFERDITARGQDQRSGQSAERFERDANRFGTQFGTSGSELVVSCPFCSHGTLEGVASHLEKS
jgi:hypothetical protein